MLRVEDFSRVIPWKLGCERHRSKDQPEIQENELCHLQLSLSLSSPLEFYCGW